MRILLALLLTCLGLSAQTNGLSTGQPLSTGMLLTSVAAAGGTTPWSPTNLANCIGWWTADSAQTNTSGLVTNLPDLWFNGWNFTNSDAGGRPRITNGVLNSVHSAMYFDGVDDVLYSTGTGTAQPFNLSMVIFLPTGEGKDHDIWRGPYVRWSSDSRWLLNSGAWLFGGTNTSTNAWFILSVDVSGSSSIISTNNVVMSGGNAGTGSATNCILMYYQKGYVAEIAFFSNTNSAANRTQVYSNWNQKYALGLP